MPTSLSILYDFFSLKLCRVESLQLVPLLGKSLFRLGDLVRSPLFSLFLDSNLLIHCFHSHSVSSPREMSLNVQVPERKRQTAFTIWHYFFSASFLIL